MIFKFIEKSRARSVLSLVFLSLAFIAVFAALSFLLFFVIPSLVVFSFAFSLALAPAVFLAVRFVRAWVKERRDLFRRMELALFGERKLLLDSLVEFDRKKIHPDLVREGVDTLLKSEKARRMGKEMTREFFVRTAVTLSVAVLSTAAVLFLFRPVSEKTARITEFIAYKPAGRLPDHYIDSKPLRIDFSKDRPFFDNLIVVADSNRYESADGVFVLDVPVTARKKVDIAVEGFKFGIGRTLARKTMESTTQLLIDHLVMTVRYPAASGISPEEMTGLQDLEVWKGATVELTGETTKNLVSMKLLPGANELVRMENGRFSLHYVPDKTRPRTLSFESDDGDRAESRPFLVKVNANERPSLRLLFPAGDIRIGQYQWSVQSLMEGDDDQGIRSIVAEALVTNRDVLLKRYAYKKKWTVPCSGEKNIRRSVLITYKDLELLPDEVASVSFRAEDLFGKQSRPVGFNIIVPDLMDIQRETAKSMQRIGSSMKDISNSYEKMQDELRDKDLSGAQQQMRRMESGVSNLSDALGELDRLQSQGIDEIRESVERMKEVAEGLKRNADIMKQLLSLMQTGKEPVQEIKPGERQTPDLLKELSSMLKNLDYYRKFSDILAQYQITKNVYDKLKNSANEKDFRKTAESFRSELEKLGEAGKEKLRDATGALAEETKRFDPEKWSDRKQFEKSDELMRDLEKSVRGMLDRATQDRVQGKVDSLDRVTEELFLYVIFIEDALKLDFGTAAEPDTENEKKATETVNSIQYSWRTVKLDIDNALSGIQFVGNTLQELADIMTEMDRRISFLQDTLKEHQTGTLRPAFYYLEKTSAYLFMYLVRISGALKEAGKDRKSGQDNNQVNSLSLQELLKMQGGMSMSMQELMERMQREGKLTPQMKEEMERLAAIQEEIRNTLGQLMKQNQSGVFEGGNEMNKNMEDIVRDLQSYNIRRETIEKSKQLEEKLLKSKKSIESRGINDQRKAETAKTYEIRPPDKNDLGSLEKLDLGSIKDKKVSEYYKKLIERYKKR